MTRGSNRMEPLRGIEPRLTDYKTVVLPLDHSGVEGCDAPEGGQPCLVAWHENRTRLACL